MKSPCLGQIPSQEKSKRARQGVPNLWAPPLSFSTMDHQKKTHNMYHKSHKNSKKNMGKISTTRKEFWFLKILSHRI